MKLTAITTCVGYDDYLRVSMPVNGNHFNWWEVVTTPGDHGTYAEANSYFADHFNGNVFQCDEFTKDGATFNKGAAINGALNCDYGDAWILLLDADILLPAHFRENLEALTLDRNCIYGMYREECDDVHRFLAGDRSHLKKQHGQAARSIGMGMFTLFHWDSQTMRERREAGGWLYPDWYGGAERSDRKHMSHWRPEHRGDSSMARGSPIGIPLPDSLGKLVHFGPHPQHERPNHAGRVSPRIDK